ncbi:hypothetical protein [Vibrio palustris]|uniref:Uncharacterized protein n=1 Tax=Vibrio palustris TaxID=1918946 RepID=A0A1R4B4E7_9VIBR|nr:hypothetical protein [Vibrio palustris]SJL83783.1 hypothetical protein VPAL9027_01761 [Vibrio palustris]
MKNIVLIVVIVAAVLFGASMFMKSDDNTTAEDVGETIDNTVTDSGNAIEDKCEQLKEKAGAEDSDC